MEPVVTIALPTYQRDEQLGRAIESVLAQDYGSIDLIISDNASTDGTRALCERYAQDHSSIRYIRQPANVGPTPNFESVRHLSTGEYFAFLGDDDWLEPDYVSACVEALEADHSYSLVAGRTLFHRPDGVEPEPRPMNIDDGDGEARVLRFCREVNANGVFYGVVPGAIDRRAPALRNVQGGDMVHVMALAYLGKIRTLETTKSHRTVGGMTVSLANVAATLGLGWFQATAPQVAIAYWVFRDLAFDSPLYAELGGARRVWLGMRGGGIIFGRWVPPAAVKFARLQLRRAARRWALSGRGARTMAESP
jgi:glycosyltransferase involved in cell wall biosynthesis